MSDLIYSYLMQYVNVVLMYRVFRQMIGAVYSFYIFLNKKGGLSMSLNIPATYRQLAWDIMAMSSKATPIFFQL